MTRSRKFKEAALIAGIVLAIIVVAVVVAVTVISARPERCPVELAGVRESIWVAEPAGSSLPESRSVCISLLSLEKGGLAFDRGSYEIRVGGEWLRLPTLFLEFSKSFIPPNGSDRTNTVTLPLASNVEAVRLNLKYRKMHSGWLPFGIGDYWARYQAPNKAALQAQRAVRAVSRRLYDRLWPPPPTSNTPGWKYAMIEVAVPVHFSKVVRKNPAPSATPPP